MWKIRILAVLIAVLNPFEARAASEPTKAQIEQGYEFCKVKYGGKDSASILARAYCMQEVDFKVLQARQKAGEEGLTRQIAELQKQLDKTRKELETRSVTAQRPPAMPPVVPMAGMPMPPLRGVGYSIIKTPGQYAATTWDIPDVPNLLIEGLQAGVRYFRTGVVQTRLLFKKNGVVLPVAHEGEQVFNEIYADLDRDGRPDKRPYKAVDPSQIDKVFVAGVGPRDDVEVVYIVPTGNVVAVPGLPAQVLWGEPVRTQIGNVIDQGGRWRVNAMAAIRIN